jgi:hypothetical protein
MIKEDLPPCLIYIDKEGQWFHKGVEMIHRGFIRFFYQNMELDEQGQYIISLRGDRCYVEVEDTPFVVWRVVFKDKNDSNESIFSLYLSDDSREDLSPQTLYLGEENVLYCKVKNQAFPARFCRAAYYQIAEYIEEEEGKYFLPLNGEKYVLFEDMI